MQQGKNLFPKCGTFSDPVNSKTCPIPCLLSVNGSNTHAAHNDRSAPRSLFQACVGGLWCAQTALCCPLNCVSQHLWFYGSTFDCVSEIQGSLPPGLSMWLFLLVSLRLGFHVLWTQGFNSYLFNTCYTPASLSPLDAIVEKYLWTQCWLGMAVAILAAHPSGRHQPDLLLSEVPLRVGVKPEFFFPYCSFALLRKTSAKCLQCVRYSSGNLMLPFLWLPSGSLSA